MKHRWQRGDFGGGDPVPKIFYVSAWHGQESKKKGLEFESICSCLGVVDSFLYIYFSSVGFTVLDRFI